MWISPLISGVANCFAYNGIKEPRRSSIFFMVFNQHCYNDHQLHPERSDDWFSPRQPLEYPLLSFRPVNSLLWLSTVLDTAGL
jgi:hypothetical protein